MITAVFQLIIIVGFLIYSVFSGVSHVGALFGNPIAFLLLMGVIVGLMAMFRGSEEAGSRPSKPVGGPSGFFSSTSIRTLLLTGSALFLFSVYLFVRSYWDLIIDEAKFAMLAAGTGILYFTGFVLYRKNFIPKTAQTLLSLGLALLPACVYAANKMLLHDSMSPDQTLSAGCVLMLLASAVTATILPTWGMGLLIQGSFAGMIYFGCGVLGFDLATQCMTLASSALLGIGLVIALQKKPDLVRGIAITMILQAVVNVSIVWQHGLFLGTQEALLVTAVNFVQCGILMAFVSRMVSARFAYLANIFFIISGYLLLRFFNLPMYKYGYFLVPAGFAALLRAWTFERDKRSSMARPYFVAGQFMLAAAVFAVCPIFNGPHDVSFFSLIIILVSASAAYAVTGGLYKQSFYSYASAAVALFIVGTSSWQFDLDFSVALLFFTGMATFLVLAGTVGSKVNDELIGQPLTILGIGTLSCCVAMSAGHWANPYLSSGTLPAIATDQLRAGLWTGGMSTLAYLFLAGTKKSRAFIYLALMSGTWVYVCWLQWMNFPIDLVHMSWLSSLCMLSHYVLMASKQKKASRCFSLWAMMLALFIFIGAASSGAATGFGAVLFCTLSFIPGVMTGEDDLVTAMLLGSYMSHFLWFSEWHQGLATSNAAEYGLQLVVLNIAVLFIRTLVTRAWPKVSYRPFQVVSVIFWALSMMVSLLDLSIAWQVFLIHAVLMFGVSMLHYEGKLNLPALVLAVAGAELLLFSRKVVYVEAYVAPFAITSFVLGYLARENRGTRDFLYGFGMILLYLPSSIYAIGERWEWHGIFLGVASLVIMLWGIQMRSRILTVVSALVLVVNGFIQSRQMFLVIPRWTYLGLGGLSLIMLAGLFEFQRDSLLKMKKQVEVSFNDWD